MNKIDARKIKESKVWSQDFKDWDHVLDEGILKCEHIPNPNKAMISIFRTGELLGEVMEKMLSQFDLSIAQKSVLESLYFTKKDYLTQQELSNYIYSSKANISSILTRMEEKGLISREENKMNKREKKVVLTKAGHEKIEAVFEMMNCHDMSQLISESDAKTIIMSSQEIRKHLKEADK